MSISAHLKRVSPWVLGVLKGQPDFTQIFVLSESHDLTIRPCAGTGVAPEFRQQLKGLAANTTGHSLLGSLRADHPSRYSRLEPYLEQLQHEWQDPAFDLGKSWAAVHYLITGCTEPDPSSLSNAVFGAQSLAAGLDDPVVQFLTAAQVRDTSAAIARVPPEVVERRYASEPPQDVYLLGGWQP